MTSAALTFDRLAYVDRLKEAGFEEKQARAHAEALDTALRDSVATKADVERVQREIGEAKTQLRRDIDEVRRELAETKNELKRDIEETKKELRRDMRDLEIRLDAKIETTTAGLKVEILRWLIVTQVALASFIFAAIKFMK
jgi:hypothetical protein